MRPKWVTIQGGSNIEPIDQAQVVSKQDNAIHQINHYPVDNIVLLTHIYWIVIYLLDSIIQPLNNRAQMLECLLIFS